MNIFEMQYLPDPVEGEGGQSAADAAASGGDKIDKPLTPEQLDQAALSAFDHGLKVATGEAEPKLNEDGSSDAVVVDGDDTVIADKGQPRAKPRAGEEPAPKAGEEQEEEEAPEVDEAIEKEIKDRGLKDEKTAERFRALANDSKELKELKEQHLPGLVAEAEQGKQWRTIVESTGAAPEQFGMALGYLRAVNSGDPAMMNQAFDAMADELRGLGKRLGRKLEALDPLEADPALLERVKKGELDRADAENQLRATTEAKLLRESKTRTETQTTQQQAIDAGLAEAKKLGGELAAAEEVAHPGQGEAIYKAKMAVIVPAIQLVRRTLPPAEWPAEIKRLYSGVQIAAPAPKPKPAPSPVRPGNQSTSNIVAKPKDDVDAFSRGLELAGRARA